MNLVPRALLRGVQPKRLGRSLTRSLRCGLALTLALNAAVAFSTEPAWAQKKKPKTPPAAAPAKPAAPAGGDDMDLDKPAAPPATPAGGGEVNLDGPAATPTTDAPPVSATSGGICDIDPSACPKESDIKAAANREIGADVYAVQQIYALRRHRLELNPYWAQTLNDQFVGHPGPGLAVNYYISNVLAIGLNGHFYEPFNADSEFNFTNRRATRLAVPLTEYQWNANLNFTYVPVYGKFAGFSDFIFHFDMYVVGGVGALFTRPIPVIDPDNRKFDYDLKVAFNAGLGLRIFFNRWLAATLEVRDYIYNEKLESLTIARNPQDKAQWYGENQLTNNVQAQLGLSFFIPPSWEYRLPK